MKILVKTSFGLEAILAEEIKKLGGQQVEVLTRAVQFEGNKKLLYAANYELRTALRILVPFHQFKTKHDRHFYKKIREVDWSKYLNLTRTFAVDAVTQSQYITHSKYLALKAKDAIVDQFRDLTGERPNVDVKTPTMRLNVHLSRENVCTLSWDSSGDVLYKRGYRMSTVEAPVNEVMAAGMIALSGWKQDCDFLDPMCGSGTLLIEAAMMAYGVPPQVQRRWFGFQKWTNFDEDLWYEVKEEAHQKKRAFAHQIIGFDKDFHAIAATNHNILAANLEGKINVKRKRFETLESPSETGLLLMNPPYDERIGIADINAFYKMIGDRFKQEFTGWEAWIISSNQGALKHLGLRPSRRITLYNGSLECKFQKFELYTGSRKAKKQIKK